MFNNKFNLMKFGNQNVIINDFFNCSTSVTSETKLGLNYNLKDIYTLKIDNNLDNKSKFNLMKFNVNKKLGWRLVSIVSDTISFNTLINTTYNLILNQYENTILNSIVNNNTFVGTNIYQNYNFNSSIQFKPQLTLRYSLGELYLNTKINNYLVDDNRYKFNFMNFGVNKKVGCKITSFVPDNVTFTSKVSNSSILTIYIYQNSVFNLLILSDLFLSLDIYLKTPFNDAIKGALFIGLDIYQQIIYLSKALHDLFLGLDIYQRFEPEYSIIYTSLKIVVLIAEIVHLDITLNKGDTLTLDSENYNFLVNNQNFIHKHHGDWITLDRNLHNLKIVNSSGQLTGKILYNERFF